MGHPDAPLGVFYLYRHKAFFIGKNKDPNLLPCFTDEENLIVQRDVSILRHQEVGLETGYPDLIQGLGPLLGILLPKHVSMKSWYYIQILINNIPLEFNLNLTWVSKPF